MDRKEALRQLRETPWKAPDGSEECSIGYFQPADAPRIARLFYAVYGEGYPVDTYYIPERLIEENARGAIRSVVARTASGAGNSTRSQRRDLIDFHIATNSSRVCRRRRRRC